ncbi:Uncharacterised protein [Cedecea lapagei]|uniref:Uncharacterized protein n=1 Tax=Cedecea lapagei TaxID=158823 RepID=A0A447UWF7_9ENTR|nr:Uncharacterised protein [Cedecea lapagei]
MRLTLFPKGDIRPWPMNLNRIFPLSLLGRGQGEGLVKIISGRAIDHCQT